MFAFLLNCLLLFCFLSLFTSLQVWDEAKRLRCEWYNDYEKTASKPPMKIADLEVVELNFRGETITRARRDVQVLMETSLVWRGLDRARQSGVDRSKGKGQTL